MIDGERYFFGDSGTDISETTATAADVLTGKYFYTSDGTKTQGLIVTRSASSTTISGNQTYYSGYYPSNWTVSGLDTSDADATTKNIEQGFTAYVNGVKITGTANIPHGVIKYTGSIESLTSGVTSMDAVNIGDYALFPMTSSIDVYNSSLSKSTATALSKYRSIYAATTLGNYAIFAGGRTSSSNYGVTDTDAYDISLSRSTPTVLSAAKYALSASIAGNYAIFAGGSAGGRLKSVDAINTSFVKSTPDQLITERDYFGAASIGNYAIFGGAYGGSSSHSCDIYDSSLIKSTAGSIRDGWYISATSVKNHYAIFGTAQPNTSTSYSVIANVFDTSLTRSTTSLSYSKHSYAATSCIDKYALFCGGAINGGSVTNEVECFNASLIKEILSPLSTARNFLSATNVGNYALIGSGNNSGNVNAIDVYYEA